MKFSVIVPIFNVASYLPKCIESVINQGYDNYELILVNDGSVDDSLSICVDYASIDSHIVVVNKKNDGLTSARKAGIEVAKGDYIACLDGDDYLDPHYFTVLSKLVESNPDCISFGYHTFFEDGHEILVRNMQPNGRYYGETLQEIERNIIYSNKLDEINYGIINPSIWSKVVKREIYKVAQMQIDNRIAFGEDLLLTTLIFKQIKSLVVTDNYLYWYRIMNKSMSREYNPKILIQLDLVAQYLKSWIGEDPRINVYLYMQLSSQISKAANALRFNDFKKIMKVIREKHSSMYENTIHHLKNHKGVKNMIKELLLENKLDYFLYLFLTIGDKK